jgi:type II secretory ATPase GspE/PulE/Tfp pilus assembly ATPase PilB-like protein
MIIDQKPTLEIERFLQTQTPFLTLYESGILKVLQGITTIEEINRVLS